MIYLRYFNIIIINIINTFYNYNQIQIIQIIQINMNYFFSESFLFFTILYIYNTQVSLESMFYFSFYFLSKSCWIELIYLL